MNSKEELTDWKTRRISFFQILFVLFLHARRTIKPLSQLRFGHAILFFLLHRKASFFTITVLSPFGDWLKPWPDPKAKKTGFVWKIRFLRTENVFTFFIFITGCFLLSTSSLFITSQSWKAVMLAPSGMKCSLPNPIFLAESDCGHKWKDINLQFFLAKGQTVWVLIKKTRTYPRLVLFLFESAFF